MRRAALLIALVALLAGCGGAQTATRSPTTTVGHAHGACKALIASLVVTVVDGEAYIGNRHATIRAVSMRSGTVSWIQRTPGGARMASSPAIYGRELIYHTISGRIYALRLSNGSLIWSWNAGSRIESSPLIKG